MVDRAALEMRSTCKGTGGSNPPSPPELRYNYLKILMILCLVGSRALATAPTGSGACVATERRLSGAAGRTRNSPFALTRPRCQRSRDDEELGAKTSRCGCGKITSRVISAYVSPRSVVRGDGTSGLDGPPARLPNAIPKSANPLVVRAPSGLAMHILKVCIVVPRQCRIVVPNYKKPGELMPSALIAHEQAISRIFRNDYVFKIPSYQRPYAWTTEQARDLFDDLVGFMKGGPQLIYEKGSQILGTQDRIPTLITPARPGVLSTLCTARGRIYDVAYAE